MQEVKVDAQLERPLPKVSLDACLEPASVLANRKFRDKLELTELRTGVRYLAAKGVVQVDKEWFTVNTGERHTSDPLKRWRRQNPQVSGRQFRKLRKRLRKLAKSRALKTLLEKPLPAEELPIVLDKGDGSA